MQEKFAEHVAQRFGKRQRLETCAIGLHATRMGKPTNMLVS